MSTERDIDRWFVAEVLPHAGAYRAFARRLCSSAEEAEDIVQEAYAKVFALPDFRAVEHGKAFVLRIIYNEAASRLRRAKIVAIEHIPDIDALGARDLSPDQHRVLAGRQELALLEAAIRALPEQCRRVVTLRRVYEMAPPQIADELHISVSTVEKHLAKGMRLLANALKDTPSPARAKESWSNDKTGEHR